jgi:hypothetical protein
MHESSQVANRILVSIAPTVKSHKGSIYKGDSIDLQFICKGDSTYLRFNYASTFDLLNKYG